ncbi:MAG TPA: hypothetical protein VJ961_06015 [Mariprofundaceae bacterium]|nr:hypothetical protein [Mariprofundaceae bacterium]
MPMDDDAIEPVGASDAYPAITSFERKSESAMRQRKKHPHPKAVRSGKTDGEKDEQPVGKGQVDRYG